MLKSTNFLPLQIFDLADCVRKIRNEFAHNITIDNILDIKSSSPKGKKIIQTLEKHCQDYESYLAYSKYSPNDYREKFKDIASLVIHAFREYEPNFIALKKEIHSEDFEKSLSRKSKNELQKFNYLE